MKKHLNYSKFALIFPVIYFLFSIPINSQVPHTHNHERAIEFPDIPGYKTMVSDFHQHAVFSDGKVWPSIRVQEGLRDGLDVMSITEHLEKQPHSKDIPHPDRNRSYQIALKKAENKDIIVVNGAEVSRKMPPGHVNAIFLKDANKLLLDNPIDVFREAKRQGAFVFWNHPNWIAHNPDGMAELTDLHRTLIEEKLIQGIEIVNDGTYSDEALQIAIDNNLTIMGTSDIHGLIDWQYKVPEGGHRPVTLVFAKEKSADAIKDGLFNRRTVVWFKNTIIGNSKYLVPLINASLSIEKTDTLKGYKGVNSLVVEVHIKNHSDANYILKNLSEFTFHTHANVITLPAHTTSVIQVKTLKILIEFELRFEVLNAVTAPNKHPEIVFKIKMEKE